MTGRAGPGDSPDLRRIAEIERADRDTRRGLWRLVAVCWGWMLLGLAVVGAALHTEDGARAGILLWSGLGVGYIGSFASCIVYFVRWAERDH